MANPGDEFPDARAIMPSADDSDVVPGGSDGIAEVEQATDVFEPVAAPRDDSVVLPAPAPKSPVVVAEAPEAPLAATEIEETPRADDMMALQNELLEVRRKMAENEEVGEDGEPLPKPTVPSSPFVGVPTPEIPPTELDNIIDDHVAVTKISEAEKQDEDTREAAAGLFGSLGLASRLSSKQQEVWVDEQIKTLVDREAYWTGIREAILQPIKDAVTPDSDPAKDGFYAHLKAAPSAVAAWAVEKANSNIAHAKRERMLVETAKLVATQGGTENFANQVGLGIFDVGLGGTISGVGRGVDALNASASKVSSAVQDAYGFDRDRFDPTSIGGVAEGFARSQASFVASGVKNLGLLGQLQGKAIKGLGDWVSDTAKVYFPSDAARQSDWGTAIGNGVGSMAFFYGPSVTAAALTRAGPRTMSALAASNPELAAAIAAQEAKETVVNAMATSGVLGGFSTAEGAAQDAEEHGASPDVVMINYLANFPLGMSEALPIGDLFNAPAGAFFRNVFREMFEEGGQEFGQTIGQNIIAQQTYDPDRKWDDGAWEAATVGIILGGNISALHQGYDRLHGGNENAADAPADGGDAATKPVSPGEEPDADDVADDLPQFSARIVTKGVGDDDVQGYLRAYRGAAPNATSNKPEDNEKAATRALNALDKYASAREMEWSIENGDVVLRDRHGVRATGAASASAEDLAQMAANAPGKGFARDFTALDDYLADEGLDVAKKSKPSKDQGDFISRLAETLSGDVREDGKKAVDASLDEHERPGEFGVPTYEAFRRLLAGTSPSKSWASRLGATDEQMKTLVAQAKRDGYVRGKRGKLLRTPGAKTAADGLAGSGKPNAAPETGATLRFKGTKGVFRVEAANADGSILARRWNAASRKWAGKPTKFTADKVDGRVANPDRKAARERIEPTFAPVAAENDVRTAVPVSKSVTPNHVISLIDGSRHTDLRPHLAANGMTARQYADRFGLDDVYPLVSPAEMIRRRDEQFSRTGDATVPDVTVETEARATPAPEIGEYEIAAPANVEMLKGMLESYGIDTAEFGKGSAKTLAHLRSELERGESRLAVRDGVLVRRVEAAGVNVYATVGGRRMRLYETQQAFNDGRVRTRNLASSIAEKMTAGEEPVAAALRGVREELGVDGRITSGVATRTEGGDSKSYPGLAAEYVLHAVDVEIPTADVRSSYQEIQDDKTTTFGWRDAATGEVVEMQAERGSPEDLERREAAAREIMMTPEYDRASSIDNPIMRTTDIPGYGSDAWKATREYRDGDTKIKGWHRAAYHLADKAMAAIPDGPRFERTAFMLIGYPGAGKSSIADQIRADHGAAHVVADDAKVIIPEYAGGMNSSGVHDESSSLNDDVVRAVLSTGSNIILEKLGNSNRSVEGMIEAVRSQGYEKFVIVYVDVPKPIAMERAIKRWRRSGRAVSYQMYDQLRADLVYVYIKDGKADEATHITWNERTLGWDVGESGPALQGLSIPSRGDRGGAVRPGQSVPAGNGEAAGEGSRAASEGVPQQVETGVADTIERVAAERDDVSPKVVDLAGRVARMMDAGLDVATAVKPAALSEIEARDLAALVGYPSDESSKDEALATVIDRAAALKEGIDADRGLLGQAERALSGGILPGSVSPDADGRVAGGSLQGSGAAGNGRGERVGGAADEPAGAGSDAVRQEGGSDGVDSAADSRDGAEGRDRTASVAEEVQEERDAAAPSNYQITDDDEIGKGGAKAKVRANIAAIRIIRKMEDEGRALATPEEKSALVKYVGWGAFAQDVFATHKPEWAKERGELADLLSADEMRTARASTTNAHYTSPDVIKGMWAALEHLGVSGNVRAIEPAAGVGHFIGMQPEAMQADTSWTAVELDQMSGKITKALYGTADVRVQGFETVTWPNDHFDLAISNVPFAAQGPYDPAYKKKMTLHDYFFVKSLDKVRPGGIVAFITSSGTMDKPTADVRRQLADKATFLGAVRLPGGSKGAFKSNAGTDVTTDIIFLRKRISGEPLGDRSWIDLEEIKTPEGPTSINKYFADNPDMMLGKMRLQGSMYRANEPVLIGSTEGIGDKIRAAAEQMTADAYVPRGQEDGLLAAHDVDTATDGIKEGAFYEKDGKVYRKVLGVGQPLKATKANEAVVRSFMGVRDAANALLSAQAGGRGGDMGALRGDLNAAYDAFVAAHGPIRKTTVRKQARKDGKQLTIRQMPNMAAVKEDPDAYKVAALENYDEKTGAASKTAVFTEDVLEVYERPEINGPTDALAVSLNESGRVDIPFIAARLGVSEASAIQQMGDMIYLDPVGERWQIAGQYLAGDVVEKLEHARVAADLDGRYARNVAALEAIQPEPIPREDISIQFGAQWVPSDVFQDFIREVLDARVKVELTEATSQWNISHGLFPQSAQALYGTDRANVAYVLQHTLNNKPIVITDKVRDADGSERNVPNPQETLAANARAQALKDAFQDWKFNDEDRASRLETLYNEKYNRLAPENYDGSHLTFPGMARVVTFPDGSTGTINLTEHRVNTVWRIIQKGNTLIDHVVGAGKALEVSEPVLTPHGWVPIGSLRVGDMVIAGDGSPTRVLGVYPQGLKDCFRVDLSSGPSVIACHEHLWLTQTAGQRRNVRDARAGGHATEAGLPKVRTTAEILETLAERHFVPVMSSPAQFRDRVLSLDPYTLGVLIGDGSFRQFSVQLGTKDAEMLTHMTLPDGIEVKPYQGKNGRCPLYWFTAKNAKPSPLNEHVRRLGLWGLKSRDKFIPDDYLFASPEARLAMLQGLMDTDGGMTGRAAMFTSYSKRLATDVASLVRSLGGVARLKNRLGADGEMSRYTVRVTLPDGVVPFRLSRKVAVYKSVHADKKSLREPLHFVKAVEAVGPMECVCIAVEHPSKLFVTRDFIVTHNTWTMVMAAMEQKRLGLINRPMIVVPNHMLEQFSNEFLQAYPAAKLLVASKDEMTLAKRKEFAGKIAAEKWDGIIITHDAFGRIRMSDQAYADFFNEQIEELQAAKEAAARDSDKQITVKNMEKAITSMKVKLQKYTNKERKDDGATFEELGIDQIILDECFPYETPVLTDRGLLPIGQIVENKLPVSVLSRNADSGALEWKPVVRWLPKKLQHKFVKVTHERGHVICTANHKIWTEGGYTEAGALVCDQVLRAMPHGLPIPQRWPSEQREAAVLCEPVRLEMAHGAARPHGEVCCQDARGHAAEMGDGYRVSQQDVGGVVWPYGGAKSYAVPAGSEEGKHIAFGADFSGSWRQRKFDGAAEVVGVGAVGADGVSHRDSPRDRLFPVAAKLLQGGLGVAGVHAGNRGGRQLAPFEAMALPGRQENGGAERSRVVSVEVLERDHPDFPADCLGSDPVVYDIEVADNHNYFANGTLVSNCHLFKNLGFATQHQRVKGVNAQSQSQRAMDMFVKIRYLEKLRPGRSAIFATGTPISNTVAELFVMQRYLQLDEMKRYKISNFDAWASTFGNIVTKTELAPDGRTFRDSTAFSEFVNVPELNAIWSRIADTKTAEQLQLPRPALKNGKPTIIEAVPSEFELRYIDSLIERADAMKSGKVDPAEDNMLKVVGEGRKIATDGRLIDNAAPINPNGKIARAVEEIFSRWKAGKEPALVQMVFLDMGVPGSKAASKAVAAPKRGKKKDAEGAAIDAIREGLLAEAGTAAEEDADEANLESSELITGAFDLYADLKERLVARGIPAEQIAFIHDAKGDDGKARLFADVKAAKVRVLFGSTPKMGVGTNVQKRLIAMHHLDAPWKPAEVEQRDGRILRQGNLNPEVEILRYVTQQSFDSYMWQTLERKAKFINQYKSGQRGARRMEDIDNPLPEAALLKAAASGDPRILEHAELSKEVSLLESGRAAHFNAARSAKGAIVKIEQSLKSGERYGEAFRADAALVTDTAGDKFVADLTEIAPKKGKDVTDRTKAGEAIRDHLLGISNNYWSMNSDQYVGELSGFRLGAALKRTDQGVEVKPFIMGNERYDRKDGFLLTDKSNGSQIMQRYERLVRDVPVSLKAYEINRERQEKDLPRLRAQAAGGAFPQQATLDTAKARLAALEAALRPQEGTGDVAPAQDIPDGKVSIEDFASEVAGVKDRMGVRERPKSQLIGDNVEDAEVLAAIGTPASTALTIPERVQQRLAALEKGATIEAVRAGIAEFQGEAKQLLDLATKYDNVHTDGATADQLRMLSKSLDDLVVLMTDRMQDADSTAELVREWGAETYKQFDEVYSQSSDLSTEAYNLKTDAELAIQDLEEFEGDKFWVLPDPAEEAREDREQVAQSVERFRQDRLERDGVVASPEELKRLETELLAIKKTAEQYYGRPEEHAASSQEAVRSTANLPAVYQPTGVALRDVAGRVQLDNARLAAMRQRFDEMLSAWESRENGLDSRGMAALYYAFEGFRAEAGRLEASHDAFMQEIEDTQRAYDGEIDDLVDNAVDSVNYDLDEASDKLAAARDEIDEQIEEIKDDQQAAMGAPGLAEAAKSALVSPQGRARLEAELRRALPADVATRVVDRLRHKNFGEAELAGLTNIAYNGAHSVDISLAFGEAVAGETIRHETIHILRRIGLFRDSEWKLLVREARKRVPKLVGVDGRETEVDYVAAYTRMFQNRGFAGAELQAIVSDRIDEEYVAKMAESYRDGARFGEKTTGLIGRIRLAVEALQNWYHGFGLNTVDQILANARSGAIAARPRPLQAADVLRMLNKEHWEAYNGRGRQSGSSRATDRARGGNAPGLASGEGAGAAGGGTVVDVTSSGLLDAAHELLGRHGRDPASVEARRVAQGFTTAGWHSTLKSYSTPDPFRPRQDFGFHVAIGTPRAANLRVSHPNGALDKLNVVMENLGRAVSRGAKPLKPKPNASIMPLYVRASKPLRMPDIGDWANPDNWLDGFEAKRSPVPKAIRGQLAEWVKQWQRAHRWLERGSAIIDNHEFSRDMAALLERLGYDSVIYKNEVEDSKDSLFVWRPEQVRSAYDYFDDRAAGHAGLLASRPFVHADLRQRLSALAKAAGMGDIPMAAIGLWHGTRHYFTRLSLDAVNTGRGKQFWGWGVYLTESEAAADEYARVVGGSPDVYVDAAGEGIAAQKGDARIFAATRLGMARRAVTGSEAAVRDKALEILDKERGDYVRAGIQSGVAMAESAMAHIRNGTEAMAGPVGPKKYRVNVNADLDNMLDLNATYGAQSEAVRAALAAVPYLQGRLSPDLDMAQAAPSDRAEAEQLAAAGVPGAYYRDDDGGPQRRFWQKKPRHFVMFDDSVMKIVSRNGEAVDPARAVAPDPAETLAAIGAWHGSRHVISEFKTHRKADAAADVQDQLGVAEVLAAIGVPASPAPSPAPAAKGYQRPEKSVSDLISDVKKLLNLTHRHGRLDPALKRQAAAAGGKLAGHYNSHTGVLRTGLPNDLKTFAHEAGHALERRRGIAGRLDALKIKYAKELLGTPAANVQIPAGSLQKAGFTGVELDWEQQALLAQAMLSQLKAAAPGAATDLTLNEAGMHTVEQLKREADKDRQALDNAVGATAAAELMAAMPTMNIISRFGAGTSNKPLRVQLRDDQELLQQFRDELAQRFSASGTAQAPAAPAPSRTELSEGFAEFFRMFLMNQSVAEKRAPRFFDEFENLLNAHDPGLFDQLDAIHDHYQALQKADPLGAVASRLKTTAEPHGRFAKLRAEAVEKGGWANTLGERVYAFINGYIDQHHPLKVAVKHLLAVGTLNEGSRLGKEQRLMVAAIDDPYKLMRLSVHAKTHATATLQRGVRLEGQLDPIGPSFWEAMQLAFGTKQNDWSDEVSYQFNAYLTARRVLAEFGRKDAKERELDPDEMTDRSVWEAARRDAERLNPQFIKAAAALYQFNQNVLTWKWQHGFLTDELYAELQKRVDYVPLNRIMDERGMPKVNARGVNKGKLIHQQKNSQRDFIPPLEAIAQDIYATTARIATNRVIGALDRMARAVGPGGGAIAERLPAKDMSATKVDLRDVVKAAAKQNGLAKDDTDDLMNTIDELFDTEAAANIFKATDTNEKGEPIVYLWEKGQRVPIRLGDDTLGKDIFDIFAAVGQDNSDFVIDTLALGSQVLRAGITRAPAFLVTNFLRDQVATWVLSENYTPFVTGISGGAAISAGGTSGFFAGLGAGSIAALTIGGGALVPVGAALAGGLIGGKLAKMALKNTTANLSKWGVRYSQFAGLMGGVDSDLIERVGANRSVKDLTNDSYFAGTSKWKTFLRATEASEAASRVGHFKAAYERAINDGFTPEQAMWEAAYAAHDVLDFSRRGSKMANIARIVTFLNVSVQGLSSAYRSLSGERNTFKSGTIKEMVTPYLKAAQGLPLKVAERKPAVLRNSAKTWIKVLGLGMLMMLLHALYHDDPEHEEFNDQQRAQNTFFKLWGVWFKYPNPFELAVPGNFMIALYDRFIKGDKRAMSFFTNSLKHTVLPPYENPLIDLYYEYRTNKSMFGDRPIVGQDLQGLPPELQFNAYTSEVGKVFGHAIDASPVMVDHFIAGIGGTLGRDFMTLGDYAIPSVNQAVGGGIPGAADKPRADKSMEDQFIVSRFLRRSARGSLSAEKFWNQMSAESGTFTAAAAGYKKYLKTAQFAAAHDYVESLPDEQRAYAYLEGNFTEKQQDAHPLNRAKQAINIYGSVRKGMALDVLFKEETAEKNVKAGEDPEKISLTPSKQKEVNEILEDLSMREARNANIVVGAEGWENKEILPTNGLMDELKAASPEVHDEVVWRMQHGRNKLYPFEGVKKAWPAMRDKLLKDGPTADISAEAQDAKQDDSRGPDKPYILERKRTELPGMMRLGGPLATPMYEIQSESDWSPVPGEKRPGAQETHDDGILALPHEDGGSAYSADVDDDFALPPYQIPSPLNPKQAPARPF